MGFLLKAKSNSGDFAPLPSGPHVARCVSFIDLGTQQREWKGKVTYPRKVRITWEIPAEKMQDGRPMVISKTYTASLDEKSNLSADLESWRNKKFTDAERDGWEAKNLLGKTCQINVSHETSKTSGRVYANITAIMPLSKGQVCEPQINLPVFFSFDDPFDPELFASLPEFVKETISKSPEYAEAVNGKVLAQEGPDSGGLEEDDIPF